MLTRIALALLGALIVAAPASAADGPPYVPVEPGKVEHRIRAITFEASYKIPGAVPGKVRSEEWIARNRYRSRMTDAATGELVAETVQEGSRIAHWSREGGLWTGTEPSYDGQPRIIGNSFATEAAIQQEVIDRGWYRLTGETATTLTYESTAAAPSDSATTTTMVLNRDFTIVRRESLTKENGEWFRQAEETELAETLDAPPAGAFKAAKAKLAKAKKARRSAKRSGRRG